MINIEGIVDGSLTTVKKTLDYLEAGKNPLETIENIEKNTQRTVNLLESILHQMNWDDHQELLTMLENHILYELAYFVKTFKDVNQLSSQNPKALEWANRVYRPTTQVLFRINQGINGFVGGRPLLEVFKEGLSKDHVSSSEYFTVRALFQDIINLQTGGLELLALSSMIIRKKEPNSRPDIDRLIAEKVTPWNFIASQINSQAGLFSTLDKVYQAKWHSNYDATANTNIVNPGSNEPKAKITEGTEIPKNKNYAVIGIGFRKIGNRANLELEYAEMKPQFEVEEPTLEADPDSTNTIQPRWSSQYISHPAVDATFVRSASDHLQVVTGAALIRHGNRLCLQLQFANYDIDTGKVDDSTRAWSSSTPWGHYFNWTGNVNMGLQKSYPRGAISGAQLCQIGNRVAIMTELL